MYLSAVLDLDSFFNTAYLYLFIFKKQTTNCKMENEPDTIEHKITN